MSESQLETMVGDRQEACPRCLENQEVVPDTNVCGVSEVLYVQLPDPSPVIRNAPP